MIEIFTHEISGCVGSTYINLTIDHDDKSFELYYRLNWMGGNGPFVNTIYGNIVVHSDTYISLHSSQCVYGAHGNIVKNLESKLFEKENTLLAFRFMKLGTDVDIDQYEKDYQYLMSGAQVNGEGNNYNSVLIRCKQHNPYFIYEDPIHTMEEELMLHVLEHVLMTSYDVSNIHAKIKN